MCLVYKILDLRTFFLDTKANIQPMVRMRFWIFTSFTGASNDAKSVISVTYSMCLVYKIRRFHFRIPRSECSFDEFLVTF